MFASLSLEKAELASTCPPLGRYCREETRKRFWFLSLILLVPLGRHSWKMGHGGTCLLLEAWW